jgi:hypothetical protein
MAWSSSDSATLLMAGVDEEHLSQNKLIIVICSTIPDEVNIRNIYGDNEKNAFCLTPFKYLAEITLGAEGASK